MGTPCTKAIIRGPKLPSDSEIREFEIGIAGGGGGEGPGRRRPSASPPRSTPPSPQVVTPSPPPFQGATTRSFSRSENGAGGGPRAVFGGGLAATTPWGYPELSRVTWGGDRLVPLRVPPNGRRRGQIRNPRSMCFALTKLARFDLSHYKVCVNPDKAELKGRRVYGKRGEKKDEADRRTVPSGVPAPHPSSPPESDLVP